MSAARQRAQTALISRLRESLRYTAHVWREHPQGLNLAESCYTHLVSRGLDQLPLCLVFDVALLLSAGSSLSLRSQREYERWPEGERALRLRYESELICRLATLPQVNELVELGRIGALPEPQLLRALELICRALSAHAPESERVSPSLLRFLDWTSLGSSDQEDHAELQESDQAQSDEPTDDLTQSDQTQSDQTHSDQTHSDQAHSDQTQSDQAQSDQVPLTLRTLTTLLETLTQRFKWSELLSEADLFELRHWSRLYTEELRIGCRQLLELSERLGEMRPHDLTLLPEDAERDARFSDDTVYPTGGITELTTSGSWENLVLSELIYIDDESPHEVDLFDVRFVENELLFYLRDEGQLSSKRRRVNFIIDLGHLFRQKTSGYEFQFSIIVCGLIYRLIRDLSALYCDDALAFSIYALYDDRDPEPLREELRLLQMLLVDEEQRGIVSLEVLSALDDERLIDLKRKPYAVVFAHGERRARWRDRLEAWRESRTGGVSGCCVSIGEIKRVTVSRVTVNAGEPTQSEIRLPLTGLSIAELSEVKRLLISKLVSGTLNDRLKLEVRELEMRALEMSASEDVDDASGEGTGR